MNEEMKDLLYKLDEKSLKRFQYIEDKYLKTIKSNATFLVVVVIINIIITILF